ncbi:hypothetical protein LCGC14_3160110, partial [marine sediment metagenome]
EPKKGTVMRRRGVWAMNTLTVLLAATHLAAWIPPVHAGDADELKIKRQEVFEFAARPSITRRGDRVTISFATKGYCDATVAVENAQGKIVRHLASGLLGPNAPQPFRKNSKKQTIIWDGKDDGGKHLDQKDTLTVRVSLGLQPRFEKTLFWSPHKRQSWNTPIISAAKEGVYVLTDGWTAALLQLFDHEGNYVRTIYPFSSDKVEKVKGLAWHTFVDDGRRLPIKPNYYQNTLLTSGDFSGFTFDPKADRYRTVVGGIGRTKAGKAAWKHHAATAMAARGGRIALAHLRLNRLAADGTSGGMNLQGPATSLRGRRGWIPILDFRNKGRRDTLFEV